MREPCRVHSWNAPGDVAHSGGGELSKRVVAVLVPVAVILALALSAAWAQGNGGGGEGNWLWRSYRAGGWFMHPILLCWLVSLIVSLERLWALLRDRTDSRAVVEKLDRDLSQRYRLCATTGEVFQAWLLPP